MVKNYTNIWAELFSVANCRV